MILRKLLRHSFTKFVLQQEEIPQLISKIGLSRGENFTLIEQIAKQYTPGHLHLLTPNRKKILLKEFERYRDGQGYFDKIATIGWAIRRLGLDKECSHLLKQFVQRIQNDEWYVNFDESIRAIETFYELAPSQKSELYEKIERNIELTMWEVNQTYYEKITKALIKAERYDSLLWQTVEYYCLRNLSMDYSPLTVINILLNFAKANQGSMMFYDSMMRVFYKGGHLFEANPLLTQTHHSHDSAMVATLIQAFGRASLKYKELEILPEFRNYVYRLIDNRQFRLEELLHVVTLMKYVRLLGFQEEQILDIDIKVLTKLPQVDRVGDVLEIIAFHDGMAELGIKLPPASIDYVTYLALESMSNGTTQPKNYLRVYDYLKHNNLEGKLPMENFVLDWINQRSNNFTSPQLKSVLSWAKSNNMPMVIKGGRMQLQSLQGEPKELSE